LKQYIVDAFTDQPFSGNPAAVCVMEEWPEDEYMRNLAMENNLSETAFLVKEGTGYRLRWFTPVTEVDLCGHATLASSFTIFRFFEPEARTLTFQTRSGTLNVTRRSNRYEMNFPLYEQREIPVTEEMAKAFGFRPEKALLGPDLVCVFGREDDVRNMRPDQTLLGALVGRGQNATAPGLSCDCVSRSFFPGLGIAEDPVCGSAHCQIALYWSQVTGKKEIHAYQASQRGGHLYCRLRADGRISISGEAVLVAVSDIVAKPAAR